MGNLERAKVPSCLKGKLGLAQTQKTHMLSEGNGLKNREREYGKLQGIIFELILPPPKIIIRDYN